MAVILSPVGGAAVQFFDNNGAILSGGLLYTYAAGTTTAQTTYTSSSGSIAQANPIVLDSSGRVPNEIWLTSGVFYKFVLKNSVGVTIGTYDNIDGINDFSSFSASSGSSLIGYQPAGTGAVATTVQAKLRQTVSVKDFGAVGDGTTNDTAAIQLALNTSSNVYFPVGNYRVTAQLNIVTSGQTVYGDGDLSKLTADSGTFTVLRAYNVNDVTVKNLKINGAGSYTGISDGACLQFNNVNYGTASGLHCTNHGFAGVLIQNSYYMDVNNNLFTSAAGSTTTSLAGDIVCNYAGGYNNINTNFCFGNGAYGITIQTIIDSPLDYQNYNQIINNQIGTHNSYGILLYGHTQNTVYANIVSNNIITGITGIRPDPTYGYTYGAGIYLQGDNQTICTNNFINSCNSSTTSDLLAPGAIGSTNSGNKIISNNVITDTAWYGITVRDPNGSSVAGQNITIENNILRNCGTNAGQSSIQISNIGNVSVIGNRIYNQTVGCAILQSNTVTTDGIIISNNVVNAFQYGIQLNYARSAIVSNNILTNPTSNVMQLNNCNYCSVTGNNIQSGTQAGFNIRLTGSATYLDNLVQGNKITSNQAASAGNYGIWVDSAYATNTAIKDNDFSGCLYFNQQTNKLVDAGTNTSISGNKFGLGPLTGTFTLGAAASTTVANTSAGYWTTIMVMPTNASAASLMGSVKALYVSAKTNDTSFAVSTANAAAAAGTETFNYLIS
jgi:hypothetical protein